MKNRPNETGKQKTRFSFVRRMLLMLALFGCTTVLYAQKTVSGVVKDNAGEPIIGAAVVVKGTTNGAPTDMDGKYAIEGVPNSATLTVSYMGYKTKEVKVGNQSVINIVIEEDMQNLEEVVVVGYGTMRRSSITGSTSRVDAEAMEGFPSTNVADAMQGRAAGVYIEPSRQPGEDPSILIRGTRSLKAGNGPLVIVDGMPGGFENLSSEDIASMEVLKDAAATAIYGSRAANGVILITTKQAKKGEGRFQIDVNSYVGFNSYDFIQMQSPEKYGQLIGDLQRGISYGYVDPEKWRNGTITDQQALSTFNALWHDNYYNKGISYDWQKALFRNSSFNQGHNISISQSTEKLQYRFSYSFQEDNSYYKTLNFKRHILNNSVDMKLAKWLNVGMITRLSLRENSGWPDNMWDNMRRMSPFETPWIDEDPANGLKPKVGKEQYVNAMWNYEPGYLVNERGNKIADLIFKADIKPFPFLTISTNLKLGYGEKKQGKYYDSYTSYQNGGKNFAEMNKEGSSNYTWNGIVTFDKTFGVHKLNATAVMEAIQEQREWVTASAQDIPARYMDYHFLDAGPTNKKVESGFGRSNLLSYMGRIQYELMGKYLFNVAIRADGSSRLAEGNKWRSFPSASAAWWISEEEFLKDNATVSSLKFRASYGEIGNQAIDSYQTLERLKSKTYSWNKAGIYTWQPDGLANKDLTWEVSKTFNTGFDFGLFKNRIGGTIEYYNTRNTGLLMQRQLPESTGFGSIWQNIGETQNQGVELTINAYPIQRKDMNWSLTGTFSRNFNKIVSLYDGLQMNTGEKWFVGQPIKLYWEYEKLGIWQSEEVDQAKIYKSEPGLVKVKDQQKEGEPGYGVINDDDRVFLGQREPKFMLSLQTGFQWKQWDVSMNIMSQGGHLIRGDNYIGEWNGDKYIIDAIDWWTPLNRSNDWPRIHTAQSTDYKETISTWKGDFVKIQDISIGYDFKKMASSKWKNLSKLRVYLQARNPLYIYRACPSDVNPEQPNTMYTIPASYVMGLNLSF